MDAKHKLRKNLKLRRNCLDTVSISDSIIKNIVLWDKYILAKNVMLFYPINSEVSLLSLLNDTTKNFYFPVVSGDYMLPVLYSTCDGFRKGRFNIMEPVGQPLSDLSILDIIFVPALAVDSIGNRLGYGKGYYDRFLCNLASDTTTIVPLPEEFFFNKLPCELHDIPVNGVVTENGLTFIHH